MTTCSLSLVAAYQASASSVFDSFIVKHGVQVGLENEDTIEVVIQQTGGDKVDTALQAQQVADSRIHRCDL
jgi:hypothetical protein